MTPPTVPDETDQIGSKTKKPHVACLKCRERKVRCSGSFPCSNCRRRSTECIFEPEDRKVVVSESYLNELKRKAGEDEASAQSAKRHQQFKRARDTSPGNSVHQDGDDRELEVHSGEDSFSALTNPLVVTPSQFVTDMGGRKRFLGPSSTWAYSRHVMSMIRQHLDHHGTAEVPLNIDGAAFPIEFPSMNQLGSPISMDNLPSLDYALYLTNTVKFHVGQTYHLFEEQTFMQGLFSLYNDGPDPLDAKNRMWFVQFFLVMALGKALLARGVSRTSPPGNEYFLRAMHLFPDVNGLYQDPIISVEVCCGLALYLQSVDHRNSAYVYLGVGLRIALTQGYHRDLVGNLDAHADVSRYRSVWWTLYILDRKFSSLIGAPSSVHDSDISVPLPKPHQSAQKSCALDMHVRLSRLLAKVLNKYFLPFDLDRAFSAGFVLSLISAINPISDADDTHLEKTFGLLDTLIAGGNVPARFRRMCIWT
ncbi:hypothetical protein ACJ41O_005643 [Fusarium nematophilum]